jgi:dihydrofolate reductase
MKPMRKIILSMQVSLDGFAAGADGDLNWCQRDDPGQWSDFFDTLESVDLFLLGSNMFPIYRDYWKSVHSDKNASINLQRFAAFAAATPHFVFSNQIQETGWVNTTVIQGDVAENVKKLKYRKGGDIMVLGGPKLAATIINKGLVDEYRLVLNPVLLSSGKSLFRLLAGPVNLQLMYAKILPSGVTILSYCPA